MSNLLIYILILCLYNSILFYGKILGINVVLFIIPLLIFIYYALKKNNKIKNKKGLLFIIPILLLSCSYFIYDNQFFKILNVFMISLFFILMYIYTIKPIYEIRILFKNIIHLIFGPFNCISKLYHIVKRKINDVLKLSDASKTKIKSILVIIPIILIVLILLSSADMIFSSLFSNIFKIIKKISISNIIGRIVIIIILFTCIGSCINYILFDYDKIGNDNTKKYNVESYTIKLLLTILNIIYIIFDFIQIRSLIFHKVSESINYSQYAREGFFQLMFISIINLIILLISKKSKDKKYDKYNKIMSILMVMLTFIIIVSSFIRMNMYESMYGYTLLRLLVYVTLITEIILLVPTIIYIINPTIKVLKYYMIIIVCIYTLLSLSPIDYVIANRNINRYYKTNKIDIQYLENNSTDNVLLLMDLYKNTNDEVIKSDIDNYLLNIYDINKNYKFLEFNISRSISLSEIANRKK